MFTYSYRNFRHNAFWGTYTASGSYGGVYGKYLQDVEGNWYDMYYSGDKYNCDLGLFIGSGVCGNLVAATSGGGVYFGTGSTPAMGSDYKLESPITSGLGIRNVGKGYNQETEGIYSVYGIFALTNNSGNTMNIYEAGCFSRVQTASDKYRLSMMERQVLTEPIVLEPGEEKLVTYKILFNHTLNVEA